MRHARDDALDQLDGLIAELRELPKLSERKRGVFYKGSKAFLHFHEDPTGLYADVRLNDDFERMRVSTARERQQLLTKVRAATRG
jgi:hypothetical protein